MSLTYIFREDPNYNPSPQATVAPVANYSIDRVVDKIHLLAGEINELTGNVNVQVGSIKGKASDTVDHLSAYFKNLSGGAHGVADIAVDKFDGFPVTPFYIMLICAMITIIVTLCYFISAGGFYCTQQRYQKPNNAAVNPKETRTV